ncbi:MAG: monomethylamine:corrinoid methyltransferase [Candidatus Heimdallarchaeota archaeon]|nr:MAG: monomethylamine:corrinoid methyltransferase [Candidatus Heimdallarchaeota archaeon]
MVTPPWRINEVLDRAQNGPVCLEKDYDLKLLVPELRRVIKEYDIAFDPATPVPEDPSLADSLWEAGIDLYLKIGTLCNDTHRRIMFSEEEVKEALGNFPGKFTLGFGRDSRELTYRRIEDHKPPFCMFTPDITCDEDLFLPMSMAYLQEPLADGVCAPILDEIEGMPIRSGYPSEIKGAVAHTMMFREAARRVGRPGIFLKSVGTAESDAAQIAASNPEFGERLTDGRFVASITELKIDNSLLNKMVHFHTYGCFVGALAGPILGGYAGGPEGTAIVGVAYHLMGLLVNQAHFMVYFPFHLKHTCNTTRELLWVLSVTHQAVARKSNLISLSASYAAAGPCTPMVLREAATHALASVVSGSNLWIMAVAKNRHKNYATPLEARLAGEVGYGVSNANLSRSDVNELVLTLLKTYEENIEDAPLGKNFRECYDVKRCKPTTEYLDLYHNIRKALEDLGIPFIY